jgi:hypothetical protein
VKQLEGKSPWGGLADDHLEMLRTLTAAEKELAKKLDKLRDIDYKPEWRGAEQDAAQAVRFERFGDDWRAYQQYEMMREKYASDPNNRFWFLLAAKKAKVLKPKPGETDNSEERKKRIEKQLKAADVELEARRELNARLIYLNIVALYETEKEKDIKELVEKAKEGVKKAEEPYKRGGGS